EEGRLLLEGLQPVVEGGRAGTIGTTVEVARVGHDEASVMMGGWSWWGKYRMVRARYERPSSYFRHRTDFRGNPPDPARPAGTRSGGADQGGGPPDRAHQAAGLARPAGGVGRMARRLAGPRAAPHRAAAGRRVRRHARRGAARRIGLSAGSHRA